VGTLDTNPENLLPEPRHLVRLAPESSSKLDRGYSVAFDGEAL
jgi:hypothetical protein